MLNVGTQEKILPFLNGIDLHHLLIFKFEEATEGKYQENLTAVNVLRDDK
jgi:hypothetical protein